MEDKCLFVDAHRSETSVDKLCRLLEIARGGYYAWKNLGFSVCKQREQKLIRILSSFYKKKLRRT